MASDDFIDKAEKGGLYGSETYTRQRDFNWAQFSGYGDLYPIGTRDRKSHLLFWSDGLDNDYK